MHITKISSKVNDISITNQIKSRSLLYLSIHLYMNSCTRHNYGLSHSEHAIPCVSSTDFRITNLVDVHWTVTVIKPTSTTTSVVDDTAYNSASALSWTRTTAADGRKGFKQQSDLRSHRRSLEIMPFDRPI